LLLERRQELRRLFSLVPSVFARELFSQLQNRTDPLGILLTSRLAPVTRTGLLGLLQNKFATVSASSGGPMRSPSPGQTQVPARGPVLPLILAGPIVRRATADKVWFWFACSKDVKGCAPSITPYDQNGQVLSHLVDSALKEIVLLSDLKVVRLGENIWIVLVSAVSKSGTFPTDTILGYELKIATEENGQIKNSRLADLDLRINYAPFNRPTFVIGKENRRLVHGSCRRPGADGKDAFGVYDKLLAQNANEPLQRPASLIMTGDQIYADDMPLALFDAVRRIAVNVFGYVEKIPNPDGVGFSSVDSFSAWVPGPVGVSLRHISWSGRKRLTHRETSPIGFTTDDGEAHLLSFPEYAAMYLVVWNPVLCRTYLFAGAWNDPDPKSPLHLYPDSVEACRRVLANTATYMLCDDHEITDDWNLDKQWEGTTKSSPVATRIIANGLAAYWGFQAWGNDPDKFDRQFIQALFLYFEQLRISKGIPRNVGSRSPYNAAATYERTLLETHWSFMAASNPKALCVDTRTRREPSSTGYAILSGPRVQVRLQELLQEHGFRRNDTLLLVTPTPFLLPPYVLRGQQHKYKDLPNDRYEGDYELYANYPPQRGALMDWLHEHFAPAAIVIFSGDVHHGSVVSGRFAHGAKTEEITNGKADWVMRVVQITSSPIKNIATSKFVDPALDPLERGVVVGIAGPIGLGLALADAGTLGELVVARTKVDDYVTPRGTHIVMQLAVRELSGGELPNHATLISENHLCVVDMPARAKDDVRVLFVGEKQGKREIARASVDTDNNPAKFKFTSMELRNLPDRFAGYVSAAKNILRVSAVAGVGGSAVGRYKISLPPLD